MPINIPASLPAAETLISENIFIMTQERAVSQDIRPLRIAQVIPNSVVIAGVLWEASTCNTRRSDYTTEPGHTPDADGQRRNAAPFQQAAS